MKLSEIPARCDACSQPLRLPFFRVRIDHVFPKPKAAREVLGVASILGGLGNPGALKIAETLAPDADVAYALGDESPQTVSTAHVCIDCLCMNELLARTLDEAKSRG